ncbi:hypothetical protein ACN47A_24615 [Myxococcus fulvus]|uniref:hypothetical protein n=1 Tax=Myxococcus fulvus TaxID=33 RepID=UPI003B9C4350
MSPPRGYDPAAPPTGRPPKKKRGRPAKYSGPASTLTYTLQTELVSALRKGCTLRIAATLAGTSPKVLENWLRRGRDAIEARKRSRYTELVLEVERAQAEYQAGLLAKADDAILDKTMNDKVLRWRLGVADREFRAVRETAESTDGQGPFELVKPEDAVRSLTEKMERFLSAAAAAPVPPPPEPEAAPEDGRADESSTKSEDEDDDDE